MRFLVFLICFISITAQANNVILMIGDGMGKNHLTCTEKSHPLFLKTLTPKGEIQTHSANKAITDSAASATAFACGIKTNNGFLGLSAAQKKCETLSETAVLKGYKTFIRTTDKITGATPAAFYAHQNSRHNTKGILKDLKKAQKQMDIKSVQEIDTETSALLSDLKNEKTPFFIVIEESEIDKQSHLHHLTKMSKALVRFDKAVEKASRFALERKDTTVIILADHETGGLNDSCQYTKDYHTAQNVLYYVIGKKADSFEKKLMDNTEIYQKIKEILF